MHPPSSLVSEEEPRRQPPLKRTRKKKQDSRRIVGASVSSFVGPRGGSAEPPGSRPCIQTPQADVAESGVPSTDAPNYDFEVDEKSIPSSTLRNLDVDGMRETIQARLSKNIQSQLGKKIVSAFENWTTVSQLSGEKRRPEGKLRPLSDNNNTEIEQGLPPIPTSILAPCTQTDSDSAFLLASRPGPSQPPASTPPSPPPSPPPVPSRSPSFQPALESDPPLYSLPTSRSASHKKCRPQPSDHLPTTAVATESSMIPVQNVQTDGESDLPSFVVSSSSASFGTSEVSSYPEISEGGAPNAHHPVHTENGPRDGAFDLNGQRTASVAEPDDPSQPGGFLLVNLYNDPDTPDQYTQDKWAIDVDTPNQLKVELWENRYNIWEENGVMTYVGKERKIPWKTLSHYYDSGEPLRLYRRPMRRFDFVLHKGLGFLLYMTGFALLLWQPWLKQSFSASFCAVLANILPMLGQWVLRVEQRSGERWVDSVLNSFQQLDPWRLYDL
ncbi:hypothetical protein DXG01_009320 [Tephrocybe rancida]|nr:hypothetical protein DXG01_009320 [Tephrocybe rancida]